MKREKTSWSERYYRVMTPVGFDGCPKRRAIYCTTRNQATDLKWRIRKWKAERKLPPTQFLEFTEEDKRRLAGLKAEIGDLSLLPRIIAFWRQHSEEAITKTTVSDAVERFLIWRADQGEWSPATADDTKSRLGIFKNAFLWRDIHSLTTSDIERWLADRVSSGTRGKYINKLRPLFRWAKRQRYLAIDPLEDVRPPKSEYKEVEIYSPEELLAMLTVAERDYRDLVPATACLAFGFMRTEELVARYTGASVLDWSAFDWNEKQIFVPHSVAKQAREGGNDRSIPINDALEHWLKPYVQSSGPLVQRDKAAAIRALAKIRKAANAPNLKNGLRHSCISYWLAAKGEESYGTVSRWSGNSAAIIKRHYLQVVKRATGQEWFATRRA